MHEVSVVVKKYKRRIFATLLDIFFTFIFLFFLGLLLVRMNLISMLWVFNPPGEIVGLILTPFLWGCSDFFFEKTPGKFLMNLVVMHKNNFKFRNCIFRNYLKVVSIVIFPFLIYFLNHPRMRGFHEIYSYTRVKSLSNKRKK